MCSVDFGLSSPYAMDSKPDQTKMPNGQIEFASRDAHIVTNNAILNTELKFKSHIANFIGSSNNSCGFGNSVL